MSEIILANNTIVGENAAAPAAPAATSTTTGTQATTAQPEAAPPPGFMGMMGGNMSLLVTMVGVFAIMYFFTIRPQRKREQQLREIQNSLQTGDWVMTFSGMYGKIVDIGADIAIIEFGTNKGIRIPVKKSELTKTVEPVLVPRIEADEDRK